MNHLHHTNHHASTLGEMQRLIAGLSVSVAEIKAAQGSPISFASLEETVASLKSKMDSLMALEPRVNNVENRLGFLESREPKLPPNLENALQLKLEHYLTKCVKERIDMLNIPILKVQLEEKISNLADQIQALSKPTTLPPTPPPAPPSPLPLPEESTISEPSSTSDDIDISFGKRRQAAKKTK